MSERLEDKCRELIEKKEYETCEKEIADAMVTMPHSAVPHNLMGILLEKEHNHILAMKHFRAAYGLDPAYVPARYNMDQFGTIRLQEGKLRYAYSEADCRI